MLAGRCLADMQAVQQLHPQSTGQAATAAAACQPVADLRAPSGGHASNMSAVSLEQDAAPLQARKGESEKRDPAAVLVWPPDRYRRTIRLAALSL